VASLSDVGTTERWLSDNDIEGYQHGGPLFLDTQVGREGGGAGARGTSPGNSRNRPSNAGCLPAKVAVCDNLGDTGMSYDILDKLILEVMTYGKVGEN